MNTQQPETPFELIQRVRSNGHTVIAYSLGRWRTIQDVKPVQEKVLVNVSDPDQPENLQWVRLFEFEVCAK